MHRRILWLSALGVVLAGCMPQPAFTPTPTKTAHPGSVLMMEAPPTQTPPITEVQPTTAVPTAIPTVDGMTPSDEPSPTPGITETVTDTPPPPPPDTSLPADHYWFKRPIPEGWTDYLDRTYAYGSTSGGDYRPHTGGDFWNPTTTPVVAVGNGTVFHAGNDWETKFGPDLLFYGGVIVVELTDQTYNGQPIYALYGHLSEVYVEAGQAVPVGEILGGVGGTGAANGGPHLHFEIRIGDPYSYYNSTRNPDLWIKPYYGFGTLAGRVVNGNGEMLQNVSLTVRGLDSTRYTWTYAGDENNPDDEWDENFTLGDLPEGWYTVTTRSDKRSYSAEVYIANGSTSWLEFVFD